MSYFKLLPSFIQVEQQLYDYFIPTFFLISFFMALPKKISALRFASFATALINGLLAIVIKIHLQKKS